MKSNMSQSLAVPHAEDTLVAWAAFLYCLQPRSSYLAAESPADTGLGRSDARTDARVTAMDVGQGFVHKPTVPHSYNASDAAPTHKHR